MVPPPRFWVFIPRKGNRVLKKYLRLRVHGSTAHSGQAMGTAHVSVKRYINKEVVAYIYMPYIYIYTHTYNVSDRQRHIPYTMIYTWNLKNSASPWPGSSVV